MSVGAAAAATPAQETTNAGAAAANGSTTGAAAAAAVTPPAAGASTPAAATPPGTGASAVGTEGAATTPPPGTEAAAAAPPVTGAPEKYDLKLPEGVVLAPEVLKGVEDFAKSKGLSNDSAQALVDHKLAEEAGIQKMRDGWLETLKADKEIGGDSLKANAEICKRIVDKYGNENVKKILNESAAGNNPDVFRFILALGKAAGEDVLDTSGSHGGALLQNEAAQNMYGKTKY